MSRTKDCAKSCKRWGLLTWALLVGLLDVSSFPCADVQADPGSLISPIVFLIPPRKVSLEMSAASARRTDTNNPLSPYVTGMVHVGDVMAQCHWARWRHKEVLVSARVHMWWLHLWGPGHYILERENMLVISSLMAGENSVSALGSKLRFHKGLLLKYHLLVTDVPWPGWCVRLPSKLLFCRMRFHWEWLQSS